VRSFQEPKANARRPGLGTRWFASSGDGEPGPAWREPYQSKSCDESQHSRRIRSPDPEKECILRAEILTPALAGWKPALRTWSISPALSRRGDFERFAVLGDRPPRELVALSGQLVNQRIVAEGIIFIFLVHDLLEFDADDVPGDFFAVGRRGATAEEPLQ